MLLDFLSDAVGVYGAFNPFETLDFYLVVRSMIIFYCFNYFALRGAVDNPQEETFQTIYPSIVAALFLTLLGVPGLFIGIIYFALYYWRVKALGKMSWPAFTRFFLYVSVLMAAFVFLPHDLVIPFIVVLIGVSYIQSEIRIRDKKIKAKNKPAEKANAIVDVKSEKKTVTDSKSSTKVESKPSAAATSKPSSPTAAVKTDSSKPGAKVETKPKSSEKK